MLFPNILIFLTKYFSSSLILKVKLILSSIISSFTSAETERFCSLVVIISISFKIFSTRLIE